MSFPYSDFDSGGGVSGVTQTLLNSKQDVLNVDGQPINTTVLNSFTIGGSEQNNETNSLVTASALENWFEAIQGSFIKVGANPSSGVRVGTIQNPPSTTDVPSCSAVVNHVTSKLTPINNQITALSNDKVDKSSVVSTLTASNLTSTNLVTEGGILNFVGNHLTENSIPVVKVQPRLYRKVTSEITDPEFSFIRNDVYDIDSGFDKSINNALATMASTHNHIIDQISENKFGINLNLMSVEFSSPVGGAGWSVVASEIPDPEITYLQQVAIEDSAQLTIIRLETDGNNYIYTPSKIQQLALPSNSAWLQNLPANVNVIHANALTGFIYVLGSTDTELDINWSIPIETKVADDSWTGVSYAIPTNHRALAYDHTTKGVCVLVRSTDTTVYSNSALSWFELDTLKEITSTEIEAYTHTDVNFSRLFLRDISMNPVAPFNTYDVGLELVKADQTANVPLLCSDVFIMNIPSPNTVTGLLAEKVNKNDTFIAIGNQAGETTQGNEAVAIGNKAGQTSQGERAVAIGYLAGQTSQSLSSVAIGNNAGRTSQSPNTVAIGISAGRTNQASNAVAIGIGAGNDGQSQNSVAIGNQAGNVNQSQNSVALGTNAGNNNQLDNAVAIGKLAGANSQSQNSVAIGNEAGNANQSLSSIAIGNQAGRNNQLGNSVAIGNLAGFDSQGADSVAIGNSAGTNTQAQYSVAIGRNAGEISQSGSAISIGERSGQNNQGLTAVAIGSYSGNQNQGQGSVAIGGNAGEATQGIASIAIGDLAGQNTQSTKSVAIGFLAGQTTQGDSSVAIGSNSGEISQGANSIAIGNQAGQTAQGTDCICLGHSSGYNISAASSNVISIGRRASYANSGANSINIGELANEDGGNYGNCIVLNATGSALNSSGSNRFYVKPIRNETVLTGFNTLCYNTTTGEICSNSNILTSDYVPVPATGGGARKCVIRNANDDGWTFSDVNLDITYRTDDITTAADWKVPSVLAVKNYALTEFDPDFSVTRNGVGDYTITFGTTQTIHYCISLTTETIITNGNGVGTTENLDDYQIVYHSKAGTGFGVYVKEQDDGAGNGTFRDCKWDFICVARGKVFSHGSVNGFTGAKVNSLL